MYIHTNYTVYIYTYLQLLCLAHLHFENQSVCQSIHRSSVKALFVRDVVTCAVRTDYVHSHRQGLRLLAIGILA